MLTFTSDKREDFNGWSRTCELIGDDGLTYRYQVSVRRGRAVRIPYKPRGKNRGWKWNGTVFENGKQIWAGPVSGSIGCRGLLIEAGVIS